jgi:hypothetical protein
MAVASAGRWMIAIVEAIGVVVGDVPATPLSLRVGPGEIVGLLFPPARPRTPVLRALAGLEPPATGEVPEYVARFERDASVKAGATAESMREAADGRNADTTRMLSCSSAAESYLLQDTSPRGRGLPRGLV